MMTHKDKNPQLIKQDELAVKFSYKNLPDDLSKQVKEDYLKELPSWLNIDGESDKSLYSLSGSLIATGYRRIVIGDYGAFIEIDPNCIVNSNLKVKEGQDYRYSPKYSNCKYYWLTAKDDSDIKVYHQKHTVTYADYKVGMYYISPYEVKYDG